MKITAFEISPGTTIGLGRFETGHYIIVAKRPEQEEDAILPECPDNTPGISMYRNSGVVTSLYRLSEPATDALFALLGMRVELGSVPSEPSTPKETL